NEEIAVAVLSSRCDRQRYGVLEPLAAFGALRNVVGLEAGEPLVFPRRTVVVRKIKADELRCAGAADVGAITGRLIDVNNAFQLSLLRVVADAAQLLIMCVARDENARFERTVDEIAEMIRIRQQQRFE